MLLKIQLATELDLPDVATRISEIHLEAFSSNLLLLAMFPNQAVRSAPRGTKSQKAIADIRDPKISVPIIVDMQLPKEEDRNIIHLLPIYSSALGVWRSPVAANISHLRHRG
ncbi:hypothetical protein BJ878DRAFT_302493 [Calycina marina]|uniref:Uncharacterized protein n=1 Tax=Calycina marina TaxID=1763456 RepID=A0A9P8CGF8_9HELO|nr:hypothetical protein BJ878DRAFT_302493 [Calycina marina]